MLAKKHTSNKPSFKIILCLLLTLALGLLCFTFYNDIQNISLIGNNRTRLDDNVVISIDKAIDLKTNNLQNISLIRNNRTRLDDNVVFSIDKTIDLKTTNNPDVLVLCTPWGGLTNVKQPILGCLQSETQKYNNTNTSDVRFLLPWLMARPIAGPFIPLELVFKEDEFVNWAQSHGYPMFLDPSLKWDNLVGREIDRSQRRTLDKYHEHVTEWASRFNVTVVRQIGDLASLKSDFLVNAFVLRDDLLPESGDGRVEDDCVVHARIEGDWKKYSEVGLLGFIHITKLHRSYSPNFFDIGYSGGSHQSIHHLGQSCRQ